MRVFVAGATGAIGKHLLPLLKEDGHEIVALSRTQEKAATLEAGGLEVAIADALDAERLAAAILSAEPDVVIHQLTALGEGAGDFKRLDQQFVTTNRLRTEATDTMLRAAKQAGARRFIVQSFCGWPFARVGGPVKTEEDPLDPVPPGNMSQTLEALRYLEQSVLEATGIEALALRFGFFYGPNTAISRGGQVLEMVEKRRLPQVGDGAGVWSFIHIDDAAQATVAALTCGAPGLYNIVDDEPAPVSTWLPFLVETIGARPPWKVPAWIAKLAIGEAGVSMMTRIRGGSNAKAKRELDWQLRYPSWRQGFKEGL